MVRVRVDLYPPTPVTSALVGRLPPFKVQRITAEVLALHVKVAVSDGEIVTCVGASISTLRGPSPGLGKSKA